jgi:hypothetical protein
MNQNKNLTRRAFAQVSLAGCASLAALPGANGEPASVPGAGSETDATLQGNADSQVDFLDRRWVEHTYFLTRKVYQPERVSPDPVIADASPRPISVAETKSDESAREREDEGTPRVLAARAKDPGWGANPASAMGTVLPTKDGLVMYYASPHRKENPNGTLIGYDKVIRYAVSADGRQFEQPVLDLCEFKGSRRNNIVIGMNQVDAHGVPLSGPTGCSGFCILDATRQPFPHARGRYTALFGASVPKRGSGLSLAWSDDGLHWNAYPENPLTPASDTFCNFHYDPRTRRYAIYIRPSARSESRRAGPTGVRSLLSRIESTDLIHWDNERVVFDTDEADAPAQGTVSMSRKDSPTEVPRGRDLVCYGMTVTPHQDGFIGQAQIYDTTSGQMWVELAHSYDGVDWRREPRREPLIPLGPAGAWDSGMVGYVAAGSPAAIGDDWFIYYTGNNWTHHFDLTALAERGRMWQIGGVRLKRGRLVGYQTGGAGAEPSRIAPGRVVPTAWANRGELLTRPFTFNATEIQLNADAGRGRVIAEICDANGKSLPGFSREQAVAVQQQDGVRLPLAFGTDASVAGLRGRTIRLRLHLESAAVFGLSFA